MLQNDQDLIGVLRYELSYLEQSGKEENPLSSVLCSPFLNCLACINFSDPVMRHACRECPLFRFVEDDARYEDIPCHYILLNADRQTVTELIERGDERVLANSVKDWIRAVLVRLTSTDEASDEKEV